MFCRNWAVSQDYLVCQEGPVCSRLHLFAAQCDAAQPRARDGVCQDVDPR